MTTALAIPVDTPEGAHALAVESLNVFTRSRENLYTALCAMDRDRDGEPKWWAVKGFKSFRLYVEDLLGVQKRRANQLIAWVHGEQAGEEDEAEEEAGTAVPTPKQPKNEWQHREQKRTTRTPSSTPADLVKRSNDEAQQIRDAACITRCRELFDEARAESATYSAEVRSRVVVEGLASILLVAYGLDGEKVLRKAMNALHAAG